MKGLSLVVGWVLALRMVLGAANGRVDETKSSNVKVAFMLKGLPK